MNDMADTTERNRTESGVVYLVATPIGNMADISERAVKVLSECSFVAAEDTRNSGLLLQRIGIKKPLIPYHEHNKASMGPEIVRRVQSGETCALITDAGTPAVSDPGEDLVVLCAESGITVHPVPGCCAAVSALSVSALPTRRWVFEGFLPGTGGERRERIEYLKTEERTVILYEAPHRLVKTLNDLCGQLGTSRRLSVCRELTKLNEEVLRGTLGEICGYFSANEPRGEFVLVLEGATPGSDSLCALSPEEHVKYYIDSGLSEKDAIKRAAKDRGVSKNEIYSIIKT